MRNPVAPYEKETAYSPLSPYLNLDEILALQDTRIISSDQTVTLDTERYLVETKEGNSVANYELVIKYPIEGKREFFVMGNKVKLTKLVDLPVS